MLLRIILSISFFGSIFLFPWFVTVLLGIALLFLSSGYEVILGGVLLDLLYAAPAPAFFNTTFLFTGVFFVLALLAFFIKKQLMMYPQSR